MFALKEQFCFLPYYFVTVFFLYKCSLDEHETIQNYEKLTNPKRLDGSIQSYFYILL